MPRLPEETINHIKQDISLLRLVESQGYQVTKQGKDAVIQCPFHDDKTPSCVISPKTNLFHCFGCGEAGSVIDWVMKTQGLSFRLACELLLNDIDAIAKPIKPIKPIKRNSAQKLTSSLAADLLAADKHSVAQLVIDYYQHSLLNSPEALAYLEKRGLNQPKLIKQFQLGYANRTLAYHIPENNREAGKRIRSDLKAIGLLRQSGHEHFNGSIVVPITNEQGVITEMYGRRISDSNANKGAPKHLYLPGAHVGVWNLEGIRNQEEVILCESLIDAMTFWVHGFTRVTASYGTQGFTDEHIGTLLGCGVKRVLIAYDRDEAGDKGAQTVAEELHSCGFECYRLRFPQGMDANSWVCEAPSLRDARERLSSAIRKAIWLGNGEAPAKESIRLLEKPALLAAEPVESEKPPLPASPLPKTLTDDVECEIKDHEILLGIGDRSYRVRGLNRSMTEGQLKINLMACNKEGFHTDNLNSQ